MKKFATLIATSALAFGGAMVVPTAASAAADPYPQSVATSCSVATNSPVREGRTARVRVNWTSAGNASPRGSVLVKIIRKKTGQVVRTSTQEFVGKRLTFKFKGLKPGGYKVRVKASTPKTSVFKGCRTRTFLRVTPS